VSSYDAFAEIYDEWSAHMTADVPFYVELAREAEGPVVDRRPFDDQSPEFVWIARRPS
jgi:hypothetical protein